MAATRYQPRKCENGGPLRGGGQSLSRHNLCFWHRSDFSRHRPQSLNLHGSESAYVKMAYSMNRRTALIALAGSVPSLRGSDSSRIPVLVELFTSEGCSSCPPADALLAQLDRQAPSGIEVVALSEHVDYWNHLGWADSFSSPLYSARQRQYASKFRMESVYTPQMVINGRSEALGSDSSKVHAAIEEAAQAPRAALRIERAESRGEDGAGSMRVRAIVESLPAGSKKEAFDLVLAITENGLSSSVSNGENSGRLLKHTGVVRSMTRIAELDPRKSRGYSATLMTQVAPHWNHSHLKAVVFLQNRETQVVSGVAVCSL
jgi:hypothetical protein